MKNVLFVGGPMNGRFSPTPNDSGHVVAKSDNIIDPRTGRHKEWKYYRKYISSKPVKRRDGRKVPRHVDVFVYEGHKMDVKEITNMLLRAVPRKMPDIIRLQYSHRMNGVTVYIRKDQKAKEFVILDKELRDSLTKTEALKALTRLGRTVSQGVVEVEVNEESIAAHNELYVACRS
jgi:hypothetical protein